MKFGSLVTIVGAPSLHLLQTNNRKQPVAQCKGGSRGRRMPTRIENWVSGAGQVLNQVSEMLLPGSKRSSQQLEVAHFTRRFRNGFNQMKDRLEAPTVEKPFRSSNPTGSNRRQLERPFPFIIIGALIAVGLAVDLILIINAGGIPGVSIPGVSQTANAKVNKVATKVETVAEVVDDLAGEEEYIVEDVDKDEEYIVEDVDEVDDYEDYEYDLPSLPVSDFTEDDLVDDEEQVVEIALDESLLAADEEEQAQPGAEDLAAVLAEDASTTEEESELVAEDTPTTEVKEDATTEEESDVGASISTGPETRSKFVEEAGEEIGGEDTRHEEDSEEKEVRFHKYDLDKEEQANIFDSGEWFNAE